MNYFKEIKRQLRKPNWVIINLQTWMAGPWLIPGFEDVFDRLEMLRLWCESKGYELKIYDNIRARITHIDMANSTPGKVLS